MQAVITRRPATLPATQAKIFKLESVVCTLQPRIFVRQRSPRCAAADWVREHHRVDPHLSGHRADRRAAGPRQRRGVGATAAHGIGGYVGDPLADDKAKTYRFPAAVPIDRLALVGTWSAGYECLTADPDARLGLNYRARSVSLVLAGKGTVKVFVSGRATLPLEGRPGSDEPR